MLTTTNISHSYNRFGRTGTPGKLSQPRRTNDILLKGFARVVEECWRSWGFGYGHQNQELDNEIKDVGNYVNYKLKESTVYQMNFICKVKYSSYCQYS